jgi:hypothetical protein
MKRPALFGQELLDIALDEVPVVWPESSCDANFGRARNDLVDLNLSTRRPHYRNGMTHLFDVSISAPTEDGPR